MSEICAIAVENLGSLDLIWGTKSLKEINGQLDFTTNTLTFKNSSIILKPSKRYVIKPNERKEIELI